MERIFLHVILELFEDDRRQQASCQHLLGTPLLCCLMLLSSPLLSASVLKCDDPGNKVSAEADGLQISTLSTDQRAEKQ